MSSRPSRRQHRQPPRSQQLRSQVPNPHGASSPRRRPAPLAICGGSRSTAQARDGRSAAVAASRPPCAIAVARSCVATAEEHSCRCGRRRALSTGRSPAAAPLTLLRSDLAARSLSPLARTRILARFVRPPWPRRWAAWLSAAARPFTVFLPPVFGCFVASWRARARQASVLGLASARAL